MSMKASPAGRTRRFARGAHIRRIRPRLEALERHDLRAALGGANVPDGRDGRDIDPIRYDRGVITSDGLPTATGAVVQLTADGQRYHVTLTDCASGGLIAERFFSLSLRADWVATVVGWATQKPPRAFGFLRSRWCCEAVALVMPRGHDVEVSRETVRRWLHRGNLVYRHPRPTFETFSFLDTGWILSHRHRYITEVIFSSDLVGIGHWSRFHRFFSHAAWDLDTFSMSLAEMALFLYSLVVAWFHRTGPQSLRFPFRPRYC